MDPTFDPYSFYGMGSGSDPFNYYATSGYSTNFAPTTTGHATTVSDSHSHSQGPIWQAVQYELMINRTTAKALGLATPDKLLALADEVIE